MNNADIEGNTYEYSDSEYSEEIENDLNDFSDDSMTDACSY